MSKTDEEKKVNDVLPDDEALSAFAAGAFGSPRKRAAAPAKAAQPAPFEPEKPTSPAPEPLEQPVADSTPAAVPTLVPAPASSSEEAPPAPAPPAQPQQAQVAVRETPPAPVTHQPTPMPSRAANLSKVDVPDLGPSGARPVQCTVMVAVTTRDRLASYQLAKKVETGREPTNAMVVRRAFLHARKQGLFGNLLHDLYNRQAPGDEEDFDDDGLLGEVAGRRTERGRMKDNVQQSFRPSMQELAAYDAFCAAYGFPNRSEFLDAMLDEFLPPLPSPGRRGR